MLLTARPEQQQTLYNCILYLYSPQDLHSYNAPQGTKCKDSQTPPLYFLCLLFCVSTDIELIYPLRFKKKNPYRIMSLNWIEFISALKRPEKT